MKKLYKYILLVIGMVAFCACTDEIDFQGVDVGGNDVTLKLSVSPEVRKDIVNSRATNEENKLYDLHFYVFNAQGKLTGYEKLVSESGDITSPTLPNGEAIPITIRTKTGTSYIYAVANINTGSIYKLSQNDKDLLNVTTYTTDDKTTKEEVDALRATVEASTLNMETFKNINFNRTLPTGNEVLSPTPTDNKFMMSGYLNDGNAVTIQKNGTDVSIKEGVNVIKLYRILAKNTLTINSITDDITQKPKFTLKSYRLYNVPVGGQLVPNANISTANTEPEYTANITAADVESHYQAFSNNSSFTFYYPENLQASTSIINAWEDREKNKWNSEGTQKSFANAPAKAAYIEIQGDYVDNNVSANVSYTIHLGNFGDTEKGGSLSNFNVIRNNNYIYTVTINGVNDIIAEARIENDNPYAEGFVVEVGNGQHYEVDAHYEARVLKFTKSSIQALKNSHSNKPGYILNVSTPFGNTTQTVNVKDDGVYTMDNVRICTIDQATDIDNPNNQDVKKVLFGDKEADFRWMRFVRNTTGNVTKNGNDISLYTCKYPGDHDRYSSTNVGGWMNVFELLAQLYDEGTYTNNDEAYYTCFIDENYYANKQWSEYVNRDPRTMQIANKLSISEDKKSVYAEVAYSISQRSIATFYRDVNTVAFGTEIFDEEDLFHTEDNPTRLGSSNSIELYENLPISNSDDWDGFTGTFKTNAETYGALNWYEDDDITVTIITTNFWGGTSTTEKDVTINPNIIKSIQPLYKSAAKACMSRNRDLNGNGEIDDGEVRWYLASGGQYHALYIAKTSLPAESWLINTADLQDIDNKYKAGANNNNPDGRWVNDENGHDYRGKYHYYTSSGSSTATYWPEEGLTLNPAQTSSWVSRAELVRCVRTLESGTSGEAKYGLRAPQKYYTFENNVFNLTGIETRRGDINEPLPNHNEIQDQNELYKTFQVATAGTASGSSLDAITGNATDPCSRYSEGNYNNWRTPNQKELGLMLAEMKSTMISGRYVPRTRFSGYKGSKTNGQFNNSLDALGYHWHDRVGFQIGSNGEYNLISNTTNVNVRCVRDVK